MDKNKVVDLAKSLSSSCKQAVKENQITHKVASPAVILIALTVWSAVVGDGSADKLFGWGK